MLRTQVHHTAHDYTTHGACISICFAPQLDDSARVMVAWYLWPRMQDIEQPFTQNTERPFDILQKRSFDDPQSLHFAGHRTTFLQGTRISNDLHAMSWIAGLSNDIFCRTSQDIEQVPLRDAGQRDIKRPLLQDDITGHCRTSNDISCRASNDLSSCCFLSHLEALSS